MSLITRLLTCILLISCGAKSVNTDSMEVEQALLFVGTYTDKEGHVDGQADGIYALRFNSQNGSLTETSLRATTTNPSYLFVDRKNQKIYSVNEKVGEGEKISAFSYNASKIEFLNDLPAKGGAPCYITKSKGHLFTANYVGGNHAVLSLKEDGSLDEVTQVYENIKLGPDAETRNSHAHMIIENPYSGQIIGVDLGTDRLTFFDFDEVNEKLEATSEIFLAPGSGPRHLDFHPSKDIIYVVNELNGTISVLKNVDGTYEIIQVVASTKNPDNEQAGCADIHVHPSGEYLFASNRGPFNTISQYRIKEDGTLVYYDETTSGGEVPRSFTLDPSGKFLLVANQNSNSILIYSFDEESGALTNTGNTFSAPTPVCLKFE